MEKKTASVLALIATALSISSASAELVEWAAPVSCQVTISGAMTGSAPCSIIASQQISNNTSSIAIMVLKLPYDFSQIVISGSFGGPLHVGSYNADSSLSFSALVAAKSSSVPPEWLMSMKSPAQGDFSLTLTEVAPARLGGLYKLHGSVNAMLLPVKNTSAAGPLTMRVTF